MDEIVRKFILDIDQSMNEASWYTMETIRSPSGFAHMHWIQDTEKNTAKNGYWFYEDDRNLFKYTGEVERTGTGGMKQRYDYPHAWIFQGVMEQLTYRRGGEEEWRKELSKVADLFISPVLDQKNTKYKLMSNAQKKAFAEKVEELREIEMQLMMLVIMTTPGPAFDVNDICYVNYKKPSEEPDKDIPVTPRNLFIRENVVTFVDEMDKYRKLPWVVGELVIRYLTVFRPLQKLLVPMFEENGRLDTYLTAYFWDRQELAEMCNQVFLAYGWDGDFEQWTHKFLHANANKFDNKYKKWVDGGSEPTRQEITVFHQRYELKSHMDLIGVETFTQLWTRQTILPFTSLQR